MKRQVHEFIYQVPTPRIRRANDWITGNTAVDLFIKEKCIIPSETTILMLASHFATSLAVKCIFHILLKSYTRTY